MTFEEKRDKQLKISNIAYYLIVGILSVILMTVIPMLGTDLNLEWDFPNTTVGWIVWIVTKLFVALINMLVFYCFMEQAKVNVKDNEKYLKANEILERNFKKREIKPKSPKSWTSYQYLSKGTTLFLTSILSGISLTQAILTFDLVVFMSLCFTLIMGVVFGYLQMRKAEDYWTSEYYQYALMVEHETEEEEKIMDEKIEELKDSEGEKTNDSN